MHASHSLHKHTGGGSGRRPGRRGVDGSRETHILRPHTLHHRLFLPFRCGTFCRGPPRAYQVLLVSLFLQPCSSFFEFKERKPCRRRQAAGFRTNTSSRRQTQCIRRFCHDQPCNAGNTRKMTAVRGSRSRRKESPHSHAKLGHRWALRLWSLVATPAYQPPYAPIQRGAAAVATPQPATNGCSAWLGLCAQASANAGRFQDLEPLSFSTRAKRRVQYLSHGASVGAWWGRRVQRSGLAVMLLSTRVHSGPINLKGGADARKN